MLFEYLAASSPSPLHRSYSVLLHQCRKYPQLSFLTQTRSATYLSSGSLVCRSSQTLASTMEEERREWCAKEKKTDWLEHDEVSYNLIKWAAILSTTVQAGLGLAECGEAG